jgi:hypothetical protein
MHVSNNSMQPPFQPCTDFTPNACQAYVPLFPKRASQSHILLSVKE